MNTFIVILRWLAILPAAMAAYVVGTWAVFFGLSYAIPEVATEVRFAYDFSGHWVFGPLIVFIWFSSATAAATYAGLVTAPAHKAIAAVILGALALCFLGLGAFGLMQISKNTPLTLPMYLRFGTEGIGVLLGFAAGLIVAYENGEFRNRM